MLIFHTGRERNDGYSVRSGDTRRTDDIEQAVTIHARHLYIGYDRIERAITQNIDHGKRIRATGDLHMVPFQKFFRQCQLQRIVVDQQTIDLPPFEYLLFRRQLYGRDGRQCLYFRFPQRQDDRKITAFSRDTLQ